MNKFPKQFTLAARYFLGILLCSAGAIGVSFGLLVLLGPGWLIGLFGGGFALAVLWIVAWETAAFDIARRKVDAAWRGVDVRGDTK